MRHRNNGIGAPPEKPGALQLLADGLLLFLMLAGLLFSVLSAYGIDAAVLPLLGACLALTALSLTVFSLPRRRGLTLLIALALFLLAVCRMRGPLLDGARAVGAAMYRALGEEPPASLLTDGVFVSQRLRTRFLGMALMPLALLLGWTVVRARSASLAFLLTFPWLAPALLLDVYPDWLPLMVLTGCWCVLLLNTLCWREDSRGGARFALLCMPATALLLALLTAALPRATYERPAWTDAARTRLERTAEKLTGSVGGLTALLPGGTDVSVRLDEAGPRRFSGRTVLRVMSDVSGRVYLRGSSAAVYTGGAWEPLDEAVYAEIGRGETAGADPLNGYEPLNFPSLTALGRDYYEMTVDYLASLDGCMFVPYQLATAPEEISDVDFVGDSHLERRFGVRRKNVFFKPQALPDGEMQSLPWEAAQAEAEYRRFVYRHYLDVPEGFDAVYGQWIQTLLAQNPNGELGDWEPDGSYSLYGAYAFPLYTADWIAHLLDVSTAYDLETPYTPEGADFVDYFLNTSCRGYCMHYASAGVLLLRASGIPARYVSGYTVEIPASGQADVPDSAAHAWAEIYLDGYGWYPVEMTPASGTGIEPAQPDELPPAHPEPVPEPEQPKPDRPDASPETPAQNTELPAPDEPEPQTSGRWPAALLLALAAAAVPVRVRVCAARRARRFACENPNAAVIAAYGYLERLEPWGARMDETLAGLARKAKFSPHTLTEAERETALEAVRAERRRTEEALPRWKRWVLRYLRAL